MGKSSPSLRVSASLTQMLLSLRNSVRSARAGRRSRLAQQRELIEASGFFDRHWYLRTYPDVKRAGVDPLVHFLKDGWGEGRDPGPDFVTAAYLEANADVARLGINPLLHFLEFGQAEGRATFGHRPLPNALPAAVFDFEPPFPVSLYPVARDPTADWLPSADLDPARPGLVEAGGIRLGYAKGMAVRAALNDALQLHRALSGYGEVPSQQASHVAVERVEDAWYPNTGCLRTRWASDRYPFVIRAVQYDPSSGAPLLIGEALLASPLDLFDLELINPFFPLMLVVGEPDGSIRAAVQLAFPSLLRGGVHYPEWLWASADCGQIEHMDKLAAALLKLLAAGAEPAIGRIVVDLDGADGSGPLFQRAFQLWLRHVMRIAVAAEEKGGASDARSYLVKAVSNGSTLPARERGATLVLGGDMIPTISALTASAEQGSKGRQDAFAPLIVSSSRKPVAMMIELPESPAGLKQIAPHSLSRWPRLLSADGAGVDCPAAIRTLDGNRPTEAELFYPTMGPAAPPLAEGRAAITWLIEVAGWTQGQLDNSLHALALQDGGGGDFLCLVGRVPAVMSSTAEALFPGRVAVHRSMIAAVEALQTKLVGYLGLGVLLHDNRTSTILAAMLQCDEVATASCVAISTEQLGKKWSSTLSDGGTLGDGAGRRETLGGWSIIAEQLWGSCYPVVSPSAHFWLARASRVAALCKSKPSADDQIGAHIYSAMTSVSYLGSSVAESRFVSTGPKDRVTRVRPQQ